MRACERAEFLANDVDHVLHGLPREPELDREVVGAIAAGQAVEDLALARGQVVDQVAMPLAFHAIVRSPVTLPTSASAVITLNSREVPAVPVER